MSIMNANLVQASNLSQLQAVMDCGLVEHAVSIKLLLIMFVPIVNRDLSGMMLTQQSVKHAKLTKSPHPMDVSIALMKLLLVRCFAYIPYGNEKNTFEGVHAYELR